MRNPTFSMYENKDADQLRGNLAAVRPAFFSSLKRNMQRVKKQNQNGKNNKSNCSN